VGSSNPDVVAVEARKATGEVAATAPETDLLAEDHPVISLTEQLTTHRELPADTRGLPSVLDYDDLLSSSRRSS
jgi:hypothetical protein